MQTCFVDRLLEQRVCQYEVDSANEIRGSAWVSTRDLIRLLPASDPLLHELYAYAHIRIVWSGIESVSLMRALPTCQRCTRHPRPRPSQPQAMEPERPTSWKESDLSAVSLGL